LSFIIVLRSTTLQKSIVRNRLRLNVWLPFVDAEREEAEENPMGLGTGNPSVRLSIGGTGDGAHPKRNLHPIVPVCHFPYHKDLHNCLH